MEKAAALCLMVAVVSFLGFCTESVFVAITERYIDNRNMVLPFILGYGLAMVAVYLVFGTPEAPRFFKSELRTKHKFLRALYYFIAVFLCISIGECCVGTFVETACDVTWWDYSKIPLNFTKFTSVPTSTGFTLLIMLFMHFFFERIYRAFLKLGKRVLYPAAVILMVLLFSDCIFSGVRMYLTHDFMILWRIEF